MIERQMALIAAPFAASLSPKWNTSAPPHTSDSSGHRYGARMPKSSRRRTPRGRGERERWSRRCARRREQSQAAEAPSAGGPRRSSASASSASWTSPSREAVWGDEVGEHTRAVLGVEKESAHPVERVAGVAGAAAERSEGIHVAARLAHARRAPEPNRGPGVSRSVQRPLKDLAAQRLDGPRPKSPRGRRHHPHEERRARPCATRGAPAARAA